MNLDADITAAICFQLGFWFGWRRARRLKEPR
jgi:hypothetical protein